MRWREFTAVGMGSRLGFLDGQSVISNGGLAEDEEPKDLIVSQLDADSVCGRRSPMPNRAGWTARRKRKARDLWDVHVVGGWCWSGARS